jgi:hypothetical protein
MELVLSKEETKAALLEWANEKWPSTFKSVDVLNVYRTIFSTEEEEV